jgi:hypothetical protein
VTASGGYRSRSERMDVISPELALVDPDLARTARALLPDLWDRERAQVRLVAASTRSDPSVAWGWDEFEEPLRKGGSRRILVGVAAVVALSLLLFDIRVEVGEKPASAVPEASEIPTTPKTTASTKPKAPATASAPALERSRRFERKFAWAPTPGANRYHVEFFDGSTRVFTGDTTGPQLTVPARWAYDGRQRSFRPGEYRWYVWAVVSGQRQPRAVVQTTLTIPSG